MTIPGRQCVAVAVAAALTVMSGAAFAQNKYGPGASDTEIKIGNFVAYSGPASSYSIVAKVEAAYIRMLNEKGGINGRKINFISYDDGYSPPKAVEQTRKLVESDEVLFLFQTLGTASNIAIMKYANTKKVPQLFASTGASRLGEDPKENPWTMPFNPSYRTEGQIYAKYILENHPKGKIAVLYQNDDLGRDVYRGVKEGLGERTTMIVAEAPYDLMEPTIDSQMLNLKASGADVFINLSTAKFAVQAIRKLGELNWKPVHILISSSATISSVMKPAGFQNGQGAISFAYMKDPTDHTWANDPSLKQWSAFMDQYIPDADKTNVLTIYAYAASQTLEHVLRQAGNDLTREHIMKVATTLKGFAPIGLLPGIVMNTSPIDHFPIEQMQRLVFKDDHWEIDGPVLSAETTK